MADKSITEQVDNIIHIHGGWKADLLTEIRAIVTSADPAIVEEVKWKMPTRPEGLPVWSANGIVCFAEIWKDNVKLLFPKGAELGDSKKLFNARLKGNTIRAIELHEGDKINKAALSELVVQAAEINKQKK